IYRTREPIMSIIRQERPMPCSIRPFPIARARGASMTMLLALAMLLAAPVADEVAAQDVAAWRVECTGDGKTLDCRAVQQLFQRESRQLLVAMLVRKAPDAKSAA